MPTNPYAAQFGAATTGEGARADQLYQQAGGSRNRYMDLMGGGQNALDTYARGAMSAAMPQFQSQLQGVRENAARRGVQNGTLGTSYEGDLASAFQRNLSNAIAGQATSLYGQQLGAAGNLYGMDAGLSENSRNRYMDALASSRDYEQAQINAKQQKKKGIWNTIGSIGGGILGGALGGPVGAAVGSGVGGGLGGLF